MAGDGGPATITLLTDFGHEDAYVGVMHGVIRTIAPGARVIDLSHGVAPQAVASAGYLLEAAHRYFPPGTIHVAVVDPGVGSARRIVCARTARATYVAPDNGLLSRVLERDPPTLTISVERSEYFLAQVSQTFHGRDIFAPVGAHLANGLDPRELGPELGSVDELIVAPSARPRVIGPNRLAAHVIHVDHFGNLVTNVEPTESIVAVEINAHRVAGPLCTSYVERAAGEPLLIMGSTGYLEVSVNGGSASAALGAHLGDRLTVETGRRSS